MLQVDSLNLPVPWFPVGVNVYLLRDIASGESLLVDTGFPGPEQMKKIEEFILERAGSGLKGILLTHGHPDHYGCAFYLKERFSHLKVYVHERDVVRTVHIPKEVRREAAMMAVEYLRKNGVPERCLNIVSSQSKSYFTRRYQLLPEEVEPLSDKIILGNTTLEIYHAPGHTPGHVLIFHRASGYLFAGDHIYPRGVPVPLMFFPVPEERFKNLPWWLKSLKLLQTLEPTVVYPGHFQPFENWSQVLEWIFSRTERKLNKVKELLSTRPMTIYELSRHLYPDLDEALWSFSFAEAQGFIDVLEEKGEVAPFEEGNTTLYCLRAKRD